MPDEAVSNIVGAFILVLIVVSAATGFAIYISETQQNTIQMGSNMMEYGLEELEIISTYDELAFEGWNNTTDIYKGVGLLFTNPSIRDVRIQGIIVDGKYISKDTQRFYIMSDNMTLYEYAYNSSFRGFKAIGMRTTGENWTVPLKNISFILPQSSITRLIFTNDFLDNTFGIDPSLPTHRLEVISARGRYFTANFAYP